MQVLRLLFTIINLCIYRSCGRVVKELECSAEGSSSSHARIDFKTLTVYPAVNGYFREGVR